MFPLTYAYHVLLGQNSDDKGAKSVRISQLVKPNDVDRFVLIVGSQENFEYAEYNIELTLHYNKSSHIQAGNFSIKMHIPYAFDGKKLARVNSFTKA